jgi:hypothetical protein
VPALQCTWFVALLCLFCPQSLTLDYSVRPLSDRHVRGVRVTDPRAVTDHGPAQSPASVRPEELLELGSDVPGVTGPFVGLGSDDPQVAQARIVVVADLLDGFHQQREARDGEVVELGRDQHGVGRDQRVHRQRRHAGRAIDQRKLAPAVGPEALETPLEALVGAAAAGVAERALRARQRLARWDQLRPPRALVHDVFERAGVPEFLGHQ